MKKLSKQDEARIAGIVGSIGKAARKKIETVPEEHQDLAWASVACAVATAAIHDAHDRHKVFNFIKDSVNTMMTIMLSADHPDDESLREAVEKAISGGCS